MGTQTSVITGLSMTATQKALEMGSVRSGSVWSDLGQWSLHPRTGKSHGPFNVFCSQQVESSLSNH